MIELTLVDIIVRIAMAVGLGALLGVERTLAGKTAGLRTYAMVSLGSCLFIIISQIVSLNNINLFSFDPLRIGAQIIAGIGFIGAGLVILKDNKIVGLTTAAGIWVSSGIGMACGFGLFSIAVVALISAIVIFTVFWLLEKLLRKINYDAIDGEGK
ncbi:MAG: MgtC/SapB family protein [bacterium]|jgi:putative Mg2+ transporter-C (MgtC) family protein